MRGVGTLFNRHLCARFGKHPPSVAPPQQLRIQQLPQLRQEFWPSKPSYCAGDETAGRGIDNEVAILRHRTA
jgi:hypothetical protein